MCEQDQESAYMNAQAEADFRDEEIAEATKELRLQLDAANDKIKHLQGEIQCRKQWQTCPQCNRQFATKF